MKTFNFTLKSLFNKGLRPLVESPRNGSYLTEVTNARESEGGLIQADKIIRTFNLNEDAIIFTAYKGVFVLTATALYEYAAETLTQLLSGLDEGVMWSMADFGDYVLFTNGAVNLIRNPTTGVFATDDGTVFPLARSICAHRGRLILGGLKDYPVVGDDKTNWVAWSDINNLAFLDTTDTDQARQNLAGYMPMPWEGLIAKIAPMGDMVIVYGYNGMTAIKLASADHAMATYGQVPIHEQGIINQEAHTTNGKIEEGSVHYFVNNLGWLCTLDSKLEVVRLGYKEFLT